MSTNICVDTNKPLVFVKDGAVFASSRDVAAFFEKKHCHVLDAIDALIYQASECGPNFRATPKAVAMPNGGWRQERIFEMTRDGFVLLAMGFTGVRALHWKLRYIDAFNAMEAELRSRAHPSEVTPQLPKNYLEALKQLVVVTEEKEFLSGAKLLLETALDTEQGHSMNLQEELEVARPAVETLKLLTTGDENLTLTVAAKHLSVQPRNEFIPWLMQIGWIYQKGNYKAPYQDKIDDGLLVRKLSGQTWNGLQSYARSIRVTPKGLVALARKLTTEEARCSSVSRLS